MQSSPQSATPSTTSKTKSPQANRLVWGTNRPSRRSKISLRSWQSL